MDANLQLIKDIIDYAGLQCPPPADVLKRIQNTFGKSDKETIDFVIKKYKQYVLSYRIKNYNTEENFIKTDKRLINIDIFIFGGKHNQEFPMPQTKLTKAMFGDRDFFELYNNFTKINNQLTLKREKALSKLKEKENVKNNKSKNE